MPESSVESFGIFILLCGLTVKSMQFYLNGTNRFQVETAILQNRTHSIRGDR